MTITPKRVKLTPAEERRAYELAKARDNFTCVKCLRGGPVQMDHRQNRQPGNTVVENLQALCMTCHKAKTEHPKDSLTEGWAVPSWADPAVWPARRWFRGELGTVTLGWVLYSPDGFWREITAEEAERRMT
jgi:hypothetical protein